MRIELPSRTEPVPRRGPGKDQNVDWKTAVCSGVDTQRSALPSTGPMECHVSPAEAAPRPRCARRCLDACHDGWRMRAACRTALLLHTCYDTDNPPALHRPAVAASMGAHPDSVIPWCQPRVHDAETGGCVHPKQVPT